METQEPTCQELVELVTDYLEQALPADVRARFEAHPAVCNGCDTYLEQMRQTISAVGRLDEAYLAQDTKERLLALFGRWHRSEPESQRS